MIETRTCPCGTTFTYERLGNCPRKLCDECRKARQKALWAKRRQSYIVGNKKRFDPTASEGMSIEQIAKIEGISPQRVSQILGIAINKMRTIGRIEFMKITEVKIKLQELGFFCVERKGEGVYTARKLNDGSGFYIVIDTGDAFDFYKFSETKFKKIITLPS